MKLSLARVNKQHSAGCWLIRELPGLIVTTTEADGGGWFILYAHDLVHSGSAADRGIWPRGHYRKDEHLALSSSLPNKNRVFRTRRDALDFLEAALSEPSSGDALPDLIAL